MTDNRYDAELVNRILHRLANGETLRSICREEGVPESSFRTWVQSDRDGLAARYAQARALQIDCLADEVLTVAYKSDLDPAERRVITENLRWLLSKLAPTKYGDRLLVAGDAANPIQHLHRAVAPTLADLQTDALDALEAFCNRMVIEHDPTGGAMQHDAVERSAPTLLDHRQ